MNEHHALTPPPRVGDPPEIDYSDASGDDYESLARDRHPVRSLERRDLDDIVAIDRRLSGRDRREYLAQKVDESLEETGVRVSVVVEAADRVAGFLMARVDYGEFGRLEAHAVIDTLGVDPSHGHEGVGTALLSQLLTNLQALRVERVRTEVAWNDHALLGFLERCGFRPAQRLVLRRKL